MTTYFLLDRKQSTTMRIDEIHQQPNNVNRFGGIATPLAFLSSAPAVPPRNQNPNHRSITMPAECEPLLPPPPPPPRSNNDSEMAWPRMVKVYPSDRRTSPVKRTHSDRVTPTREIPFRPRNFRAPIGVSNGPPLEGNGHSQRLRGRNLSETSLSRPQQRVRRQGTAAVPYSSVDDISSINQTSGSSSSSDESPSEISHSNEPPIQSPVNPISLRLKENQQHQNQIQQKSSLPGGGNLSILKEICATAASSDGLYDSTVANAKNANHSIPQSNCATNYMGDSCTSFEFLGNANKKDKSHSTNPEENIPMLKDKGSGHSTGGSGNGGSNVQNHRKITPNSTFNQGEKGGGEKSVETRSNKSNNSNNGNADERELDGSAASTGTRKDSSCQTEKSYVKGNRISDFEKEIKKLLERQHLPQVDELASVQKVLSVMGKLSSRRDGPSTSGLCRSAETTQIGLAALQHKALKQQEQLEKTPMGFRFPLQMSPLLTRAETQFQKSRKEGKDSEYENVETEDEDDEAEREEEEIRKFEEEEQRILGKGDEVSQSEWSDEEESEQGDADDDDQESTGYATDDPALENISVTNENGLTDAEGALSDVNSIYAGDDDISISSRASSRLFDSDALVSMDSLNTMFEDSEYEFSDTHLSNLRSMTESIAKSFGQPQDPASDSD